MGVNRNGFNVEIGRENLFFKKNHAEALCKIDDDLYVIIKIISRPRARCTVYRLNIELSTGYTTQNNTRSIELVLKDTFKWRVLCRLCDYAKPWR